MFYKGLKKNALKKELQRIRQRILRILKGKNLLKNYYLLLCIRIDYDYS